MKLIHNSTISCFCKETEAIEAVRELIESFLPENLDQEKIQLEEEHLKIIEGENLIALKAQLTKERHNTVLIEKLLDILSDEQKREIMSQDNRVDDKGMLFIRLDKEKLLQEQTAELVDHGNCIHFKFLLAAYPKTRAKALAIRDLLFTPKNL